MNACSVILVRESAEQLTGSGCCGKLEGDNASRNGEALFADSRRHQQHMGRLYRAVREHFQPEQVDVIEVDPRNQLYLSARLLRDVVRFRPRLRDGVRTALQAFSLPAVVVNGRVVASGGAALDAASLLRHIKWAVKRR
ncbi:MAG: hypothetical protein ACOC46_02705 [Pirellulales bacterium]